MCKQARLKITRWVAPCLGLILALLIAGCYTALNHPRSTALDDAEVSGGCLRCHGDLDDYDDAYAYWGDYYTHSYSPWINYYDAPWWHNTRWDRCDPCVNAGATPQVSADPLPARPRVTAPWRLVRRTDAEDLANDAPDFSPQLTAPRAHVSAPAPIVGSIAPIASSPSQEEPKAEPEKKPSRPAHSAVPVKPAAKQNQSEDAPEEKETPKSRSK